MADVAKRFASSSALTAALTTYGTVPAGKKWIVRNVHYTNEDASAATLVQISMAGIVFLLASIAARTTYDWSGFLVLDAGETIQASENPNNIGGGFYVSGVEVDA